MQLSIIIDFGHACYSSDKKSMVKKVVIQNLKPKKGTHLKIKSLFYESSRLKVDNYHLFYVKIAISKCCVEYFPSHLRYKDLKIVFNCVTVNNLLKGNITSTNWREISVCLR